MLALWVASLVFDGITYYDRFWILVLAGLVFGLVNLIVRPIVILLALPAVILTLGIAVLLVNALMLILTDKIVPPFEVEGYWTTVGGALIVWAVNMVVNAFVKPEERVENIPPRTAALATGISSRARVGRGGAAPRSSRSDHAPRSDECGESASDEA